MPPVDFQLHGVNEFVRKQVRVSAFRHILPDKFVGVLYGSILPRGVRVSKINRRIQFFGNPAMVPEL